MTRKGTIFLLSAILAACISAFYGFRGFVNSIGNQRTCEWANIDNIEIHAHIDVPKVTQWDCHYEKDSNTKKASFTIDRQNFDISKYVEMYNFKRVSPATDVKYNNFLNLEKDSLIGSDLYYKKGPLDAERYDVLLDKTTGRLWVTIQYQD